MEVSVESEKLSGKIRCGLIENLAHGVDFLIGNDLQEEMPLHLSSVMTARTYNTDGSEVQDFVVSSTIQRVSGAIPPDAEVDAQGS